MQTYKKSFLLSLCILSSSLPSLSHAKPYPALKDEDFKRITFVGRCAQNQWATSKDEKLEIMISAEPGESCEARLHFAEPQDLTNIAGLRFLVRSSRPKQRMAIELVSNIEGDADESVARTRPFSVTDEWAPNGIRLQRMKKGWQPKAIKEIRFITMSEVGKSAPSLFLGDIRFTERRMAALLNGNSDSAAPLAADIPLDRQMVCVAANELSSLQKPGMAMTAPGLMNAARQFFHELRVQAALLPKKNQQVVAVGLLWLLTALLLSRRKKPSLVSLVSPLYEINMRTWKSTRNADGVLSFGGFPALSATDLKDIKASGFNSIWLMGIWDIGSKVRAISKRYGPDFQGSPFAIRDYEVSGELGSSADFDVLVDRAHAAGLKVIVDFVPNHMGIDSDWLNSHPEYFIHQVVPPSEMHLSDMELEQRYPGCFVHRTPSYPQGNRRVPKTILVSYGKDPYFYPWIDTAQLDYAEPTLRRKMTEVLCDLARKVDGVRCDMAMLVLREQVKIHRHPNMSWEAFNRLMPDEFWPEAIRAAKSIKSTFTFMAETYWSMEGYLQQLGFDYTYNKPLYEALCGAFQNGNAEGLLNFVRLLGNDFLSRGVHFIENHDEERAMNSLGEERQRGAATALCTLPGVALLHQGQLEGQRERLPVQRAVPIQQETPNSALRAFYERLLKVTAAPLFREGRLTVLYSNNASFISYARVHEGQQAIVVINASNQLQKGSISLMPGLQLKSGTDYELRDLFYDLKSTDIRRLNTVLPVYPCNASQLINNGLYVELAAYDAHIFVVQPASGSRLKERVAGAMEAIFVPPTARVLSRLGWSHFRKGSEEDR